MKICLFCNIEFDDDNKKYCSETCYKKAKSKRQAKRRGKDYYKTLSKGIRTCLVCNHQFIKKSKKQKYCSTTCSGKSRKQFLTIPDCLDDASKKIDKQTGYVRVYCPMHPKASTWGYVYEHRLIMENIIGRYLTNKEHVHHINRNRWDNRPENLQVLSDSEHAKITAKQNKTGS